MNKALETLKERGFFAQCSNLEELSARMDKGPVTFYVGCDPTGPSLHIGHLVPFFAFRYFCRDKWGINHKLSTISVDNLWIGGDKVCIKG